MLHIRRETIKDLIVQNGSVNVQELIERFDVSGETIRRDLEALEQAGHVKRVYGGAVARPMEGEPAYAWRKEFHQAEKRSIAAKAASLVEEGDTVFLSYGTTMVEVAKCLRECSNITVITNSVMNMAELGNCPGITVYSLGGKLHRGELSLAGVLTMQNIQYFNASKIIMGVGGITPEAGVTDSNLDESQLLQACAQRVPCVIAVADHSKFGVVAAYNTCPISRITHLITDAETPEQTLIPYRAMGAQVHIAAGI